MSGSASRRTRWTASTPPPPSAFTPYGRARAAWTRTGSRIRVEATIPPNTTATVELPDGHTLEVGSGTHEWEVDAAPEALPLAQVGLDSSLAAVIDDPEAYRLILEVLEAGKPVAAHAFQANTQWKPGRDLGEAISNQIGPELRQLIADRLAELSAARGEVPAMITTRENSIWR